MAVLVEPDDPATQTSVRASFGEQRFLGAFYLVAGGDGLYGAARDEFEQTHEAVGANRWRKTTPVSAYQIDVSRAVDTLIDGHLEVTVVAQPGDWIVRQSTGEVMVLRGGEFAERYVVDESERANS
jgi:hypothetical protein